MLDKQKILITGSSGCMAGNFIRSAMYEKKYSMIVGVDKISNSIALNSLYQNKNASNYIADITDQHIFSRIVEFEKPDVIIHAASSSKEDCISNNILGIQSVVKAALKFKAKLIYISTDKVYGQLISENDSSWTEESKIAPRNLYAASKASGEHIVHSFGNSDRLDFNIVRISNSYGPRQSLNKLITKAFSNLINEEKVKIFGNGSNIRDWLHIRDSYTGIQTIIDNGISGQIYNLGTGQEFSDLEVVNFICKIMQKDLRVEFIKDNIGRDFRYSMCCDKLKNLGWQPSVKFKDGIQNTVEWLLLNRYWTK